MIENKLVEKLRQLQYKISFVESCTGGLLASTIINVSGSSNVIDESYVTYSNEAKTKVVKVEKDIIDKYGVYSNEVSYQMAKGLKQLTSANICVSTTGEAEGSCKCYYTIIINDLEINEYCIKTGSRNDVRNEFVKHILSRILEEI